MRGTEQIVLMARYNAWMNDKCYDAAGTLAAEELSRERGAFFGSIIGTMNHIVVGDTIWLKRFATLPGEHAALAPVRALPMPTALNQVLFPVLDALRAHRGLLDTTILRWAESLTEQDLGQVLRYANTRGVEANKRFASLVAHFFNHQTHHRGQVTALLHQAGVDVGLTDLLALIPDEPRD